MSLEEEASLISPWMEGRSLYVFMKYIESIGMNPGTLFLQLQTKDRKVESIEKESSVPTDILITWIN